LVLAIAAALIVLVILTPGSIGLFDRMFIHGSSFFD